MDSGLRRNDDEGVRKLRDVFVPFVSFVVKNRFLTSTIISRFMREYPCAKFATPRHHPDKPGDDGLKGEKRRAFRFPGLSR